jgi:hypothetical protein
MDCNSFGSEVGDKIMTTVIRNMPQLLKEMEKIKELSVKQPAIPVAVAHPAPSVAPLSLDQINAKLDEYRLVLEGDTLPEPIRIAVQGRIADLVKEQFRLVHGLDENGNSPMEAAIVETATEIATKSVIETLAAAPESESSRLQSSELESIPDVDADEDVNLAKQEQALNEIDEADALVVPATVLAPKELQWPQAVLLSGKEVAILRAALRANLMHIVIPVLSAALEEK